MPRSIDIGDTQPHGMVLPYYTFAPAAAPLFAPAQVIGRRLRLLAGRKQRVLADGFAGSRDNNLNLVRMIAALAVLVSHAWPLSLGAGAVEPLQTVTGHSLGTLAVYVFFAASGFLIAASFERTQDWRRFLMARFRRLFPGLLVSLLVVCFVFGPLLTSLPLDAYFSHPDVWTFVPRNLALVSPQYTLPETLAGNPYPKIVGSIWTLAYEVACYLCLLAAGLMGAFRSPPARLVSLMAYGAFFIGVLVFSESLHTKVVLFQQLSLPFAAGCLFYLARGLVPLSASWLVLLAAVAILLNPTPLAEFALVLAIAYATLWFAFVPRGGVRRYNRSGDYSYGCYLYAFPVQGMAVFLWGDMGPALNIALSLPPVLALSALSWHFVERPFLRGGPFRGPAVRVVHQGSGAD